ncbi:putative thiol peroxidase, partial [Haemophilus influenzae]
NRREAVFLLC